MLTAVFVFLSHSNGTEYRPLYSLSARKYTSCRYSLPKSLSTVAFGYSSSVLGNRHPGQPFASPLGYGRTTEMSMMSVNPLRWRTMLARWAKGQKRPDFSVSMSSSGNMYYRDDQYVPIYRWYLPFSGGNWPSGLMTPCQPSAVPCS